MNYKTIFPIAKFQKIDTPFYYYDTTLLAETLKAIKECITGKPIHVHYALKANANPKVISVIRDYGFGVDCVSDGEIQLALETGFDNNEIVFAGVAKTDKEISYALDANILCFNVESIEELEIIDSICSAKKKHARVCLRINPNIDAHTHHYITTGLEENKFGIDANLLGTALAKISDLKNIEFLGLHFHIGSQITITEPFELLCSRINEMVKYTENLGFKVKIINVGGGLGIDYDTPDANPIAQFRQYFEVFESHLDLSGGRELHCELGRSIVAQCGSLISRVIYIKQGVSKNFAMIDAGMNNLIRPALYEAHHCIENLTSTSNDMQKYEVVGPVCESADVFDKNALLPITKRNDILAIRSAGAYGEVMGSNYNCRPFAPGYTDTELCTNQ